MWILVGDIAHIDVSMRILVVYKMVMGGDNKCP